MHLLIFHREVAVKHEDGNMNCECCPGLLFEDEWEAMSDAEQGEFIAQLNRLH